MDIIPIIPYVEFIDIGGREKHLYFIKVLRLVTGFKILNVSKIMEKIKAIYLKRLDLVIDA
jgi:hypothetical protein